MRQFENIVGWLPADGDTVLLRPFFVSTNVTIED